MPVPTPDGPLSETQATGRDLYAQRCAGCRNIQQPTVPQQSMLAQLPVEGVVGALVEGTIRAQAAGLGRPQIDALAAYLTVGTGQ